MNHSSFDSSSKKHNFSSQNDYVTKKKLPPPRPGRGGLLKILVMAIIALSTVGASIFWLTREPEKKEILRQEAADTINNVVSGTPLAGLGDVITSSPPPPPPQVLNPPTEVGTLAGRYVTGTIAAPIDVSPSTSFRPQSSSLAPGIDVSQQSVNPSSTDSSEISLQNQNNDASTLQNKIGSLLGMGESKTKSQVTFNPGYIEPVKEDSRIRPGYLSGLAQYLVNRYKPSTKTLVLNVQSLNQECGVKLANQTEGGRSALLRYAFQPTMIQGLYNLYINRFMEDLNIAAKKKGFNNQENRNFHTALARESDRVANALDGVINIPDLNTRLSEINNYAQKSVDINTQVTNEVFELDNLRTNKASSQQINAVQMRIDGLTAQYRRAIEEYSRAQRKLAADIRKASGQTVDDESLLFIAFWVERRLSSDSQARISITSCSNALRDLAKRCLNAAQ